MGREVYFYSECNPNDTAQHPRRHESGIKFVVKGSLSMVAPKVFEILHEFKVERLIRVLFI